MTIISAKVYFGDAAGNFDTYTVGLLGVEKIETLPFLPGIKIYKEEGKKGKLILSPCMELKWEQ